MPFKVLSLILLILFSSPSFAKGGGASEFSPVAEIGVNFHTGLTGKSMTGALGQFVTFRAEGRKGFVRMQAASEVQTAVGKASIGAETPSGTLYGSGFLGGVHIFVIPVGRIQPFFGGSGVYAWHYLKITTPPTGVEPQTQTMSFGYEASAGVDIRTGGVEGNAIRIRSGYWNVTGKLGGVSGFQLHGFRIAIGVVW